MAYRLGIDVGGTFTDLLLIEESAGKTLRAKVPSTPADPSRAILAGIARICGLAGIEAGAIGSILHGTTVATNAVLEGKGARVGLITTEGFRYVLHIARSHIPGGLGGWITHPKPQALAPLELTIEAPERIDRHGAVLRALDDDEMRRRIGTLRGRGVEAVTISLFNAYVSGEHEQRIRAIVSEEMPGIPVSISSEILPEMFEYERAQTAVVNSYVSPIVSTYVGNLERELKARHLDTSLHILRSDGGLSGGAHAAAFPVNLLMSGPAGGVAGALWVGAQAGYGNLLTLDMGGTSTDVALIEKGVARLRRETAVGDVTVRASCLDVRTVGAGGGSIARVPPLTRALRVGPESAGAEPGPAVYGRGGALPTVTDANALLGYLPNVRLGGDMTLDYGAAETSLRKIAEPLGLDVYRAAEGIVGIVNETMCGALRAVSVQQGYDPRHFALMAFGGAGPLHANALGRLMQSWPVIIPPAPGVLCAYGDATTRMRSEASRTLIRLMADVTETEVVHRLRELEVKAIAGLNDGHPVPEDGYDVGFEMDCRYQGQGLTITLPVDMARLQAEGFAALIATFDAEHLKLFTFALPASHEIINLRAVVMAGAAPAEVLDIAAADGPDPSRAELARSTIFVDGSRREAIVYDRTRLLAGHVVAGPAIVCEMDSTTLILPGHVALVDRTGCLIITPATPDRE